MVPPRGTEVDMMRIERLVQLMTGGGDRARHRWEFPALLVSYNGLYTIYIERKRERYIVNNRIATWLEDQCQNVLFNK